MARRGIKSGTQLHRMLVRQGAEVSERSVRRLIQTEDPTLSLPFLCHLLSVLDCGVQEVIQVEKAKPANVEDIAPKATISPPSPQKAEGKGGRVRKAPETREVRSIFSGAGAPAKNILQFEGKKHGDK